MHVDDANRESRDDSILTEKAHQGANQEEGSVGKDPDVGASDVLREAQAAFDRGDFRRARTLARTVIESARSTGTLAEHGPDETADGDGADPRDDARQAAERLLMRMAPDRLAIGVGIACLVAIVVLAWTYLGR